MAHYICEFCGQGFKRGKRGDKPIRFCSQRCYHDWRKAAGVTTGQFRKGHETWNKGMKGLRVSPATEFKPGHRSINHCEVGTVKIRHVNKTGRDRAWVKVAEPNVWRYRCHVVWEEAYGPIPAGLLIHHLSGDTLDDALTNLAAISRAAHLKAHRPDFEEKRAKNAATGRTMSRKRIVDDAPLWNHNGGLTCRS